jgi:hypothetical protein
MGARQGWAASAPQDREERGGGKMTSGANGNIRLDMYLFLFSS